MPWRVQCPVRVCAALAAGLGGEGRRQFSFPPACCFALASRSPRCVLRVVLSGCPFHSPASTPFHAVCAFRGLGPVALQVRAACPLRVCALVLSRCTPVPPLSVWRAHRARYLCKSPVGPLPAVFAPPRFLPWSRAPSIKCVRGAGPVPASPCLALGRLFPWERSGARGGAGGGRGTRGGGWRAPCASPPWGVVVPGLVGGVHRGWELGSCAARGEVACLSRCLPYTGTKAGFLCIA